MMLRKMATAATALALVTAPVAASAADANRTSAPVSEKSELAGSPILLVLAALLIGAGIYFAVDGDDDDPISV